MSTDQTRMLPYSMIVGQGDLRRALEIAYVSPRVGGVLATGQRGTAKSTTVRAFAQMVLGRLPVTLPIGATDDRVLGGWDVEKLIQGHSATRPGLLEQAHHEGGGLLYIDEVNLLDDYLVNIILDAAAWGTLAVEREGIGEQLRDVRFTLIGTMNPEEGSLRPQLLDRFGLVAFVASEEDPTVRHEILRNVLAFESDGADQHSAMVSQARAADAELGRSLAAARERVSAVTLPDEILALCARIAGAFSAAGHRGELATAYAAQALAAIDGSRVVTTDHVARVVPLTLVHRRSAADPGLLTAWTNEDAEALLRVVAGAR
ncbi:AAA family ATPase [Catellatospora sp. NPDC049111]|uniref:ATP-binding protein n=1 Tax=Catellatospora sp. NPDC049111 TaxID=3155271 RepID=UPI0033E3CF1E